MATTTIVWCSVDFSKTSLSPKARAGFRIGVDLMGSDSTQGHFFDAIAEATAQVGPNDQVVIFGTSDTIDTFHASQAAERSDLSRLRFERAAEVIEMEDAPLYAIRQKKDSSLIRGVRALKAQEIDAFITAGNTGALIAAATIILPMLPGVERPALLALLPTRKGFVTVVDVGGNVSAKAAQLVQFAKMGVAFQRTYRSCPNPTVGLLNIGAESKKGTPEHRQAYDALCAVPDMAFVGNVEGREVFQGRVDVLATDGFTGNIFLKTSEGVSSFILEYLAEGFGQELAGKAGEVLRSLALNVDYDEYPGAIVAGVDRILIKCHGASSSRAMLNGILGALDLLRKNWLVAMREQLQIS